MDFVKRQFWDDEEEVVPMTFMVELSQKQVIDKALGKMMSQQDGPTRRADALEFICQAWSDCRKCQEDLRDGN